MFVKKDWGYEIWFANVKEGPVDYCGKLLFVEKDIWSSGGKFHYHKIKDETFFILEGVLQLDYIVNDDIFKTIYLKPHETFRIKPFMKHRFTAMTDYGCKFVETSTFHSDEDSYRIEWDFEQGKFII
jgi:mannose-6-phosphate isomerase-like protein (cupin superfamily)